MLYVRLIEEKNIVSKNFAQTISEKNNVNNVK